MKGIYILIPFRNLVCIRLPGTSANCLQCLSLCLLGARVRRVFVLFSSCECTVSHETNALLTHAQTGLSMDATRSELYTHAGVITMQVDH